MRSWRSCRCSFGVFVPTGSYHRRLTTSSDVSHGVDAGDCAGAQPDSSVFSAPPQYYGKGRSYYLPDALLYDRSTKGSSTARRGATGNTEETKVIRVARGPLLVDVSRPPVTPDEILSWKLDRVLYADQQPIHFYPTAKEPLFLLPPHSLVASLGPEMDEVDRVYRQKGLFTPSEMAQVFFSVIPTYFVESTSAFKKLPSNLAFRLESLVPRGLWVSALIARYPMLFTLRRPRFQRSTVKLNSDLWFVRAHPLYGSADRLMQAHNADYKAHGGARLHKHAPTGTTDFVGAAADSGDAVKGRSGGTNIDGTSQSASPVPDHRPVDLRIFDVLVRNLPRVSGSEAGKQENGSPSPGCHPGSLYEKRYRPVPLVEWINTFSAEELNVLNLAPQDRVVTIMNKYTRVFQLMLIPGSAGASAGMPEPPMALADVLAQNTFVDRSSVLRGVSPSAARIASNGGGCGPSTSHGDAGRAEVVGRPGEVQGRATLHDAPPSGTGSEGQKKRESMMKGAVQDDFVGLDDIMAGYTEEQGGMPADAGLPEEFVDLSADAAGLGDNATVADADEEYDDDYLEVAGDPTPPLSKADNRDDADTSGSTFASDQRRETYFQDDASVPTTKLDLLWVRRLPPDVSPRCLCNLNVSTSPDPHLVGRVAAFLAPPPSLKPKGKNWFKLTGDVNEDMDVKCSSSSSIPTKTYTRKVAEQNLPGKAGLWRWVSVSSIYQALSRSEQSHIRQVYKGFVGFLRLHGELFELSADFTHVIAHDPTGVVAPLVPSQKRFAFEERVVLPRSFDTDSAATAAMIGEEERRKFESILGKSQLPSTRQQLVLLDPMNPLLSHEVLEEEVVALLPRTGAVSRPAFMRSLPPLVRASLPNHFTMTNWTSVVVFQERGTSMVQRRDLGIPASQEEPLLSVEEAVQSLRESVPVGGATLRALVRMHLADNVVRSLEKHFGSLRGALLAYPHYFRVTDSAMGSLMDTVVELVAA